MYFNERCMGQCNIFKRGYIYSVATAKAGIKWLQLFHVRLIKKCVPYRMDPSGIFYNKLRFILSMYGTNT